MTGQSNSTAVPPGLSAPQQIPAAPHWSTIWVAPVLSLITAAATLAGTYLASYSEAERAETRLTYEAQAKCVDRVDESEKQFRQLAEGFSVSVGRFEISLRNKETNEQMLPILQSLSDSGRKLGVHSSNTLNETTLALIEEINTQILNPSGNPSIDAKMTAWHRAYTDAIKSFDVQRSVCASTTNPFKR